MPRLASTSLLSSKPTCPLAAHWTLFPGDPQATSPYICHFSDSLSRTATRSYPDPHPLFHLTSHQIPGFGLLSLSSPYALSHFPESRLSRHRSGHPHRAPWLQACPVCSVPHTEAWGIFRKCKSDHLTPLLKILQCLSTALSLALGLTWCGQVLPLRWGILLYAPLHCCHHREEPSMPKAHQAVMACGLFWAVPYAWDTLVSPTPQSLPSGPSAPYITVLHSPKAPEPGSEASQTKREAWQWRVCRGGSVPGVWHSKGAGTTHPGSFETLDEGSVLKAWILGRS